MDVEAPVPPHGATRVRMRPIPAGIVLGTVGTVLFGVYHWFFVAPVVAVFVEGLLWAGMGGAAIGWAYQRTMLDRGRGGPLWGIVFGVLFASTLIPSEIVGLLWGPFPQVNQPGDVLPLLPLAFLGVPVALVISWLLQERRGVAWSFVVAVTVVHFMIGGSIANFGGRGATAFLFVGFFAFEVVAGLGLGLLAGRGRNDDRDAEPAPSGIPTEA